MAKPTEPNISIPQGFANEGQKTDFLEEKIQKGFDPVDPDVLAGDNLNKFIDDTYKGLNYTIDSVNDLYKGAVLYDVRENYSSTSIVFNIEDDGIFIYKSLTDDNLGNPLSDETKWKKVDLGDGGSGTGGGFSLFDVVEKDHILSFEESMGFGLLGTYVYKEPVAGSRYGYPDFYNRCVEEFEAAVTQAAYAPNVHNKGCFIDSNSVVSGFSLRNFVQPTSGFYPNYYEGQPFEMGVKLNATALSGIQTFVGSGDGVDFCGILMQFSDNKLRIGATNNGTSWNIVNLPAGTNTYSIDTDYWFKFEYTGTK